MAISAVATPAHTPMTIEAEFLIVAVRRFLNPEAALPDPKPIDWTALVGLAAAHAVTPMLYAALREQSVPEAVQENLRCALEDSVRRSLAQSGEFARVAGLLEERGIPVVALKGPLLSHYLYGGPWGYVPRAIFISWPSLLCIPV